MPAPLSKITLRQFIDKAIRNPDELTVGNLVDATAALDELLKIVELQQQEMLRLMAETDGRLTPIIFRSRKILEEQK